MKLHIVVINCMQYTHFLVILRVRIKVIINETEKYDNYAMYNTLGTIKYYDSWCIIYIDNEIIKYYRSLVPKYYYVNLPKEKAHVSVVRVFELPANLGMWRKYEGHSVVIQYLPIIQYDNTYFWLNCWCNTIGNIREELGLNRFRAEYPDRYHITVGNRK